MNATSSLLRMLPFVCVLAGACRPDGTLGGVEVGFRVDGTPIDFGRALEGTQVIRSVTLQSTGRVDVTVETSTEGPFSAPRELLLPGGAGAPVEITFTAGAEKVSGRLHLSSNGKTVSIPLQGEGVRPLTCVASKPCRTSRFVLETNTCVEAISPEGATCTPEGLCLENGVCQAGECMGAQRSCDDHNPCTADACAPEVGCLHTQAACPAPTAPCRVAICDPSSGCGEAFAPDGTPCGRVDCVTAQLCVAGECRTGPTPEGFVCAPKTPCQGEGQCKQQQCVRPDPGEMVPAYSVSLALPPSPPDAGARALVAHHANLFWEMCGEDGGCQRSSLTGSGFERFRESHADQQSRQVVTASDAGLVVLAPDGLEAYSAGTGAPLWSVPLASLWDPLDGGQPRTGLDQLALRSTGELWAAVGWALPDGGTADGGEALTLVRIAPDGGVLEQSALPRFGVDTRVALGADDALYLYDPRGPLATAVSTDAGLSLQEWGSFAGEPSLVVGRSKLLAGGRHLVELDGGGVIPLRFEGDAGDSAELLTDLLLLSAERGFAFYRACAPGAGPSCGEAMKTTSLRAFSLADGGTEWEVVVLEEGEVGRVDEAALMSLPGGALAALTEVEADGGWQAQVELFASGQRAFRCPLPSSGRVGGAVFDRRHLYVFVERNGAWRLEAYELGGLSTDLSGWPQPAGAGRSRRAR